MIDQVNSDEALRQPRPDLDPAGGRRRWSLVAALAGLVSWYFTRFVIDDDELRIETGALFKQSKKVPFERLQSVDIIQPFAARLFGLAELRLEAGAGGSGIKLRYLSQPKASRLRDYLLTRAHGTRASIADVRRRAAGQPADRPRPERPRRWSPTARSGCSAASCCPASSSAPRSTRSSC